MEELVASAKFPALDKKKKREEIELSEDETKMTRTLVAMQNKKKKKSGGFQSMGFGHSVFTGIMKKGYRVPTPIQRKCIPLVMDGKDVVAMARTGSGKTAAFLLPMLERLQTHSTKIGARAVILSPTRELATQTFKFCKELGKFTDLRFTLVLGGDNMDEQFSAIHKNPDIIIATPGRFLHLVVEMNLHLTCVEYVVFDEADRLFELGFAEQLQDIIRRLPESRQTVLFSATLPRMLVEFAKAGLHDPILVRLDVDSKLSEDLKLFFFTVRGEDKASLLLHLLQSLLPSDQLTVVFAATKHHVEYLRELLESTGISCTCVYSSLDQTARKINVAKFVSKKTKVMLVTDLAARGIDIPMLDNVINYNFPAKSKLFVHRVGRVARAGRAGSAYSLISPDELPYLIDLHLFLSRPVLYGQTDTQSGVLGSVPQVLLDESDEVISHMLASSPDLCDLQRVSENAQKQYLRSRSQPSPESVKQAKKLAITLPVHPLFTSSCSSQEVEQHHFLDHLRQYKPSQTIFEVNSTTKTSAKEVMKSKRTQHAKVISTVRQKAESRGVTMATGPVDTPQEEETEEWSVVFQTEQSAVNQLRHKKKLLVKDAQHYIHYTRHDHHSEVGLSVDNFDTQANSAVLDLDEDDQHLLQKAKTSVQWDRKRKKFVGPSREEEQKKKKIKTESGHWITASYKSDAYKRWRDKHKVDTPLLGQEEEKQRAESNLQSWHGKSRKRSLKQKGSRRVEADLKPRDKILHKRWKKDTMERRKRNTSENTSEVKKKGSGLRKKGSDLRKPSQKKYRRKF